MALGTRRWGCATQATIDATVIADTACTVKVDRDTRGHMTAWVVGQANATFSSTTTC